MTNGVLRKGGSAASVASSQFAVAGANYLLLALAARHVGAAGFAVLTSYYLLINTVGRGVFAAVELETTRSVAHARATGVDDVPARQAALRQTGLLLAGVALLVLLGAVLLAPGLDSYPAAVGLLALGAVAMAASYLLRGPLAGHRRYGLYSATFWAEAAAGAGAAIALALAGITSTAAWVVVLALAPLLAAILLARPATRPGPPAPPAPEEPSSLRSSLGPVLWSAALLLAGQGVWNIAPVIVTSRLVDDPAAAAGFVTAAVILRAPVLLFPSVQAFLLPAFTAMSSTGDGARLRRIMRVMAAAIVAGGVVWVALAVFVVPVVAHLVFAATTTPPAWVLATLALSTVIGAAAQIGQTQLVAQRRPAAVAVAWIAGLAVLVALALVLLPVIVAGTLGQLVGAIVVVVVIALVARPAQKS